MQSPTRKQLPLQLLLLGTAAEALQPAMAAATHATWYRSGTDRQLSHAACSDTNG